MINIDLKNFSPNRTGTERYNCDILKALNFNFPREYIEIMELYNGGQIETREFTFIFWPVELLNKNNEDYGISERFSKIFLFGGDGGGSGFGFNFDSEKIEIISIELIGAGPKDIQIISNSFLDLLKGEVF